MDFKKQCNAQLIKALEHPGKKVKMVLDTDTYNEVDDQYALTYALKANESMELTAVYAAPFLNDNSTSPGDGMEKSYEEILRILELTGRKDMTDCTFKGSTGFLADENTPQPSPARDDLIRRAMNMPEGERLYICAIGAITNVASAIITEPNIINKIVILWLGGHRFDMPDTIEFNLIQDVAAARIIFNSGVPLVLFPCSGVVSHLTTTEPELREHLKGKSDIGNYLYNITCKEASGSGSTCWSRVIWDVSTVAWLAGGDRFMESALVHSPLVSYDGVYSHSFNRHFIRYIYKIHRDRVFESLFNAVNS